MIANKCHYSLSILSTKTSIFQSTMDDSSRCCYVIKLPDSPKAGEIRQKRGDSKSRIGIGASQGCRLACKGNHDIRIVYKDLCWRPRSPLGGGGNR